MGPAYFREAAEVIVPPLAGRLTAQR